ncbi:hypothetical protein QBC33DRAFT_375177 [Phialemonium atrogriseum]|uniref:Pre-mRNA splicing factor CLF1 n=1 Tax=Phialemonium atrogriseum TaxID=1093897 RepID=A0AAJ0FI41_9PEZI|nr:uncharacterized protein QBC33DRAFT_375177 [Phialemonium atrogriseum]KAK1768387.1 hypothetical protein QBC33DRAFT_375177 [Phialemonium atrogriseum]
MPLPNPPVALDNACSVIFNNTLYTFSAAAFQALPLSPGAKWKKLPHGEKVTGGVCVGSTPGDPKLAGLYVVGGKGKTPGYQGLQKFTYSTGKWEAITPETPVTQDRLWHGAVYLNGSDSILLYAGAQDGAKHPSTQTFTVGASAPYAVSAFQSVAPPTTNPILLQWSDSQAALVGGSTTNTQVTLFSPETSWVDSGASLAEPLEKDITAMKAVLVKGDDGSKNLYVFDMTVSPNLVKRIVLVDGQGAPVQNSAPVVRSVEAVESRLVGRRDAESLTVNDWPQYNSTLAPKATRSNYAVAEDLDGLIVFSGGNDDDILCMFNGRGNSWRNATAMLVDQTVLAANTVSLSESATPTATSATLSTSSSIGSSTATATPTPTSTQAAATDSGSGGIPTNTVLGISLGSIFGLAVVLILLYLCLERRRKRQANIEAGNDGRGYAASTSEKDSIVFASDSLPRGPVGGGFRGHQVQDSQGSFSSIAILMGRIKQQDSHQPEGVSRNPSHQTKRSSTSSIFNKAFKSTISKPMPQGVAPMTAIPPPPPQPADVQSREDKGVSFAPDTAGTKTTPRAANAAAATDRQGATRRSSGWNRYWSGGSALNILGFGHGNGSGNGAAAAANSKRMTVESARSSNYSDRSNYRITQDSATVPPLNVYEPRASFSRVNTGSPTIAYHDSKLKEGMSGQIERPVSALSDGSAYSSGIPASVHEAWDPTMPGKPWGSDRAPSSAYSSGCTTALAPAGSTAKQPAQAPTGVSRQPQLAMASTSSDMSWLNLGDHKDSRV